MTDQTIQDYLDSESRLRNNLRSVKEDIESTKNRAMSLVTGRALRPQELLGSTSDISNTLGSMYLERSLEPYLKGLPSLNKIFSGLPNLKIKNQMPNLNKSYRTEPESEPEPEPEDDPTQIPDGQTIADGELRETRFGGPPTENEPESVPDEFSPDLMPEGSGGRVNQTIEDAEENSKDIEQPAEQEVDTEEETLNTAKSELSDTAENLGEDVGEDVGETALKDTGEVLEDTSEESGGLGALIGAGAVALGQVLGAAKARKERREQEAKENQEQQLVNQTQQQIAKTTQQEQQQLKQLSRPTIQSGLN